MIPSLLLSLREGIEAALIIGIVLGTLKKIDQSGSDKYVWLGVINAVGISTLVGIFLYNIGVSFEGAAEEIFEGTMMFIAAGVLTWMIFWMRKQSSRIKDEIESGVRLAVGNKGAAALFVLAFTAVLREGIELAIFLTAASFTSSAAQTLTGAALGLTAAVVLGYLIFTTSIRLNMKQFFNVTSALLILFAAGLVAYGVHEFNEAGWIPSIIEHVWDINHILDEESTFGTLLKALFGYNGNPSLTEILAYFTYFGGILLGIRRSESTIQSLQRI